MQCPLCFQEETELFHQDKVRSYQRCLVCELVFVPPKYLLSAQDEKTRYDLHENNSNNEGYKQFLLQLVTPMLDFLEPGDKGLDFGCGPEPVLESLFDSDQFKIDLYDPFYANKPEVLAEKYNFITSTEVVEHLYYPAQVFQHLVEMLCKNGTLGLMTKPLPDKATFSTWWYKNDLTHVCFYSEATFAWIADKWQLNIEYRKGDVVIYRKL
jgi:hypothetical protein